MYVYLVSIDSLVWTETRPRPKCGWSRTVSGDCLGTPRDLVRSRRHVSQTMRNDNNFAAGIGAEVCRPRRSTPGSQMSMES